MSFLKDKFKKHSAEAAPAGEPEEEITEEASKREKGSIGILRKVRNNMIRRRLEGSVSVSVTVNAKTSSCGCDVTTESAESTQDDDPESAEAAAKSVPALDMMLNSLEKKAHNLWAGVDFRDTATIGTSISFGLTLGPFGLTFSVSVEASVPSLLAAYDRRATH